MAAAELSTQQAHAQLKELTECCICAEIFNEPTMLPCVHTFCLGCLQQIATKSSKKPGDAMSCPVCRREFTIPIEGFTGLQKNYFVQRIVEITTTMKTSSDFTSVTCDQCRKRVTVAEASGGDTVVPRAEMFCDECCRKLCGKCSRKHQKKEVTKSHKLLELGNQMSLDEALENLSPKVCDRHSGKKLKMYCCDCKTVVCASCFTENHRAHEGSPVSHLVHTFRAQINKDLEKLSGVKVKSQEKRAYLEKERERFVLKTSQVEKRVVEVGNEIKEFVNKHTELLLEQLKTLNKQHLTEIDRLMNDIDVHLADLDSFATYALDVTNKGSTSDVCLVANELNEKIKQAGVSQEALSARQPRTLQPSFQETEIVGFLRKKKLNFGCIEENADYGDQPCVLCTVRPSPPFQERPVWGVAVLAREMFLVMDTEPKIEAYDTTTFTLTRRWFVDTMTEPRDLRSCPKNRCLFVFNWGDTTSKEILKLCPESQTVLKRWSTGNDAGRLSVSWDSNVLLAVHNNNKLKEYTTNGHLVRDIKLDSIRGSRHPWHALKLTNGQYVVSYGDADDAVHGICVMDATGNVLRSFGGKKGSSWNSLDVPANLCVDKKGSILVADHNNERVLVLNTSLQPQKVLVSRDEGLRKPIRLALDEANGRLYVADIEFDFENRRWKEGEVLVVRLK